jgi:hypothetical protein
LRHESRFRGYLVRVVLSCIYRRRSGAGTSSFMGDMSSGVKDAAQEFAERVAKLWYSSNLAPQKLSAFIANQLRAGGVGATTSDDRPT